MIVIFLTFLVKSDDFAGLWLNCIHGQREIYAFQSVASRINPVSCWITDEGTPPSLAAFIKMVTVNQAEKLNWVIGDLQRQRWVITITAGKQQIPRGWGRAGSKQPCLLYRGQYASFKYITQHSTFLMLSKPSIGLLLYIIQYAMRKILFSLAFSMWKKIKSFKNNLFRVI